MTKTASELKSLGKQLSDNYLQSGNDMTEKLAELVNVHNLNTEQIKRVAEFANVETYVNLVKREDRYVDFPLADPHMVVNNLEKEAETLILIDSTEFTTSDYAPINKLAGIEFSFNLVKGIELEKQASKEVSLDDLLKEANQYSADLSILKTEMLNVRGEFSHHMDSFNKLCKQACLQLNDADYIKFLIKEASSIPEALTDLFVENTRDIYTFHLIKTADINNVYKNTLTTVINNIESSARYLNKLSSVYINLEATYKDHLKNNNIENFDKIAGIGSFALKSLTFPFKHPVITAAGAAVPVAYAMGKKSGKLESQPLNKLTAKLAVMPKGV